MRKWGKGELEYLKNNYKEETTTQIGKKLERSRTSVMHKLQKLGLKRGRFTRYNVPPWSSKEMDFLKENYLKMSISDIATKLGRGKAAIVSRASKLGIARYRRFKPDEIEFIKANYRKLGTTNISKILMRSKHSVYQRAHMLGLTYEFGRLPSTKRGGLTESETGYLSGMVDGEGCISGGIDRRGRERCWINLSISNTNENIINRTKSILSKVVDFREQIEESHYERQKDRTKIIVGRLMDLRNLLEILYPYLAGKKKQAKLAIELIDLKIRNPHDYAMQRELFEAIEALNT